MVKSYIPESEELKKYIDLFYVFTREKPGDISYIAFPHTDTAISLFENAEIIRSKGEVTIQIPAEKKQQHAIEVVGKYTSPFFVHYKGDVKELAIVFKPLGISYFIEGAVSSITPGYSGPYNDTDWLSVIPSLFGEATEKLQISLLEKFLLTRLQKPDLRLMHKALEYLEDLSQEYSIAQIASLVGMNLKTFQRHVYRHLGCSPSDYRRIARFRHSLRSGLITTEIKKLTTLAYDSNYYDQSYFVREYKKLTRHSPRQFFNTISLLDDRKIIWEIR